VRLLVDESISPRVAALLTDAGHDAQHLKELGLLGAPDEVVMAASLDAGRVLVSADTDFGDLLALGRHVGPSVVILRRAPRLPVAQAALLLANLPVIEDVLIAGAVVVMTGERVRYRLLPMDPQE